MALEPLTSTSGKGVSQTGAAASFPWRGGALVLAILIALPVYTIFGHLFLPREAIWSHLAETVLADYLLNSLWLTVGVGAGSLLLGVTSAWLVTLCHFPGRRTLEWALLLPMAMPAYIIAYTYSGLLAFEGPLQSGLREHLDLSYGDYWFPEMYGPGAAIVMLALVLYPYVYLLSRAAFLEQGSAVLEAGRILGAGPWTALFRLALPLARPAIVTGLALVLMETLADYGTMQYLGVDTFTTGIFRTWFGFGDVAAAAQLAAALLVMVLLLIALERSSRQHQRFHHDGQGERPRQPIQLRGASAALATGFCLLPVLFGFLVPAGQLTIWAWQTGGEMVDGDFIQLAWHSLALAAFTAFLALALGLFLAYAQRLSGDRLTSGAVRVASMGYAVPGTVIAVGVLIPFAWIDNQLDGWLRAQWGLSSGLLLSGTLVALVFAYLVRFLAISVNTLEAGLGKIRPSIDEAARSLGRTPAQVVISIHRPLLHSSLLTCLLLVFVDVLKELPATLVLRPFDFNTLAVRAFELASDERLADSSTAALAIVLVGLIPVILLSRSISRPREPSTYE